MSDIPLVHAHLILQQHSRNDACSLRRIQYSVPCVEYIISSVAWRGCLSTGTMKLVTWHMSTLLPHASLCCPRSSLGRRQKLTFVLMCDCCLTVEWWYQPTLNKSSSYCIPRALADRAKPARKNACISEDASKNRFLTCPSSINLLYFNVPPRR